MQVFCPHYKFEYKTRDPHRLLQCRKTGTDNQNQKLFVVCDTSPMFPSRNGNDRKQTLIELRIYSKHQSVMVKVKHKEMCRVGQEAEELLLN